MVQKVGIDLIKTEASGTVVSEQGSLVIKEISDDKLSGNFDKLTGTLILNIPNTGKLQITGFTTVNDIGMGASGLPGIDGDRGLDGLSGNDGGRGTDGCPGARGNEGQQGRNGNRGAPGRRGPTGNTGATGNDGEDGKVEIYIQSTDPSLDREVSAGAIWVKV